MTSFSLRANARSLLAAAVFLSAAVAVSSCCRARSGGMLPAPPDSVSAAAVLAVGDSTQFIAFPGAGDEQRLALGAGDTLRYGPLARLAPAVGLDDDNERFARARVVARIDSDGEYAKLGLRRGRNYVVVQRVGSDSSGWRAWVYAAADSSRTPLEVRWEDHKSDPNLPKGARWLWRADDEDLWTRCGSGCCTMSRAFR